jgi:hypothetical protein
MMKSCMRYIAFAVVIHGKLFAQEPGATRLQIPADTNVRCASMSQRRAPTDSVNLRFEIGRPPNVRSVEVGYDVHGAVTYIQDILELMIPPQTVVLDVTAAMFPSGKAPVGHTFQVKQSAGGSVSVRDAVHDRRPLTTEQIRDARALADWLWERRCSDSGTVKRKDNGVSMRKS